MSSGIQGDAQVGRGFGDEVPQKLKPWYTNFDVLENEYTKNNILAVLQCLLQNNVTLAFLTAEFFRGHKA